MVPQIKFWIENIYEKPPSLNKLGQEYYGKMLAEANRLLKEFQPPYTQNRPPEFILYEVVVSVEDVENLKGIIGDNYRFLKKIIEDKKKIGKNFMIPETEGEKLKEIETVLTNIAPNLQDSLEKRFYVPFDEIFSAEERQYANDESFDYDVFLSYSSKDIDTVNQLRSALEEMGFKTWLDENEILPGDDISQKISAGMRKSKFIIVCVSPNFSLENQSPYTSWELSQGKALELAKKERAGHLIPILIGRANVPSQIFEKNYADLSSGIDKDSAEFKKLIKKLQS